MLLDERQARRLQAELRNRIVHVTVTSMQLSNAIVGLFFFNDTATTEIYTLSLHDALPISHAGACYRFRVDLLPSERAALDRSEEHTSELQSQSNLVCRLLLEKKKKQTRRNSGPTPFMSSLSRSHRLPYVLVSNLSTMCVSD